MLERTGSDPGFVNCGYLAVGEADREPRIRTAIEAMRSQGVVVEELDNAGIRALEPRLAAGALTIGAYEPDERRVRAAVRRRRLRAGRRAAGRAPLLRHPRDRGAARRRGLPAALRRRAPDLRRSRGGVLRRLRAAPHALARRLAAGRPRARAGRPLPPAVPVRPARADRLAPLARHLAAARRRRRALPRGRARRLPRPRALPRALGPGRRGPARAGAARGARRDASSPARRAASSAARGRAGSTSRPTATPSSTSLPRRPGLLLASGMSGHAFKLCPALGLGAAELLLDGEVDSFDWTPVPLRPLRTARTRSTPIVRGAGGTGTG